jgi:hypothetical protein
MALTYARTDTPPGIKRGADLVKAPLVRVGVLSPSNHLTVRERLAMDLLGISTTSSPAIEACAT